MNRQVVAEKKRVKSSVVCSDAPGLSPVEAVTSAIVEWIIDKASEFKLNDSDVLRCGASALATLTVRASLGKQSTTPASLLAYGEPLGEKILDAIYETRMALAT